MALLHQAELVPSKLEAVAAWAPSQPWFEGDPDQLEKVAAFRLDDPAGEVGVEVLLVRAGDGPVLQVPLTYRGAPLEGGDEWLVGTMQHSVLGERWVYDGCGDPVFVATTVAAALTGDGQADEVLQTADGERVPRESTMVVVGSGTPDAAVPSTSVRGTRAVDGATVIDAGSCTVVIARTPDAGGSPTALAEAAGGAHDDTTQVLSATWPGHDAPTTLAVVLVH
jgi:hypothetical protein